MLLMKSSFRGTLDELDDAEEVGMFHPGFWLVPGESSQRWEIECR